MRPGRRGTASASCAGDEAHLRLGPILEIRVKLARTLALIDPAPDRLRTGDRTLRHVALLLALGFTLTACDDSPTDPVIEVDSIDIQGPTNLAPGDTAQAIAFVFDVDGNVITEQPVTWTSSDESVAEVSETGLIMANVVGTTRITGTADGVSDFLDLEVGENPCASPVGAVEVGGSVEGELTVDSCFLESWFHDPWQLDIEEETTVQIDLVSTDFDAYLLFTDSIGTSIAEDDDAGEGDDARLVLTLEPATYFVWASTYEAEETGTYTLSVMEVVGGADPSPALVRRLSSSVPAVVEGRQIMRQRDRNPLR